MTILNVNISDSDFRQTLAMVHYSVDEYVDMLLIYGECRSNAKAAARHYAIRYPDRVTPSDLVFRNCERRLRETGSVKERKNERQCPATRGINEEVVLAAVAANPQISTREIATNVVNVSQTSVIKIVKNHKFHPYHMQLVQELHGEDSVNRMVFCHWMTEKIREDDDFLSYVMFSDESRFNNTGIVNRHNMHYWADVNPHWMRQSAFQVQWGINVWCGIIGNFIIGPYFFEGHLTGARYLHFLQHELPLLLENVPRAVRIKMWFQHDGAPAHYFRLVRQFLNEKFPGKCIGRGCDVPWPPRSPDLTSPDFFLWGYIKATVYKTQPRNLEDLKDRITQACAAITPTTLRAVRENFESRLITCIDQEGGQFEHLI